VQVGFLCGGNFCRGGAFEIDMSTLALMQLLGLIKIQKLLHARKKQEFGTDSLVQKIVQGSFAMLAS